VDPLFCVINGRTQGRARHPSVARAALRRRAADAGVRRRTNCAACTPTRCCARGCRWTYPTPTRTPHAGRDLHLAPGPDPGEIIQTVRARRPPMIRG